MPRTTASRPIAAILVAAAITAPAVGQTVAEPVAPLPGPASVSGGGVARATAVELHAVRYARGSRAHTLDLYLPPSDGARPVPVVVLIHGGGFRRGGAAMMARYGRALARHGLAAAAVNYRLSGEARFPAGAQDVKASVRWLRAHAADYGLDGGRVGAWGRSAGGWMANMLGATGRRLTIFDNPALGNPGRSSAVQAVVSWFGPVNFATMDAQARLVRGCAGRHPMSAPTSPVSRWFGAVIRSSPFTRRANLTRRIARSAGLPPWYIAQGTADCIVPIGQARELSRALARRGDRRVRLVTLRGAHHGDPRFDATQVGPTIRFLERALHRP